MKVEDGTFIVLSGAICAPCNKEWQPEARKTAPIKDNILLADITVNSPSTAGWIVLGTANNGWIVWKDKNGKSIDIYRKNEFITLIYERWGIKILRFLYLW